jgi:hypothetical protein
MPPGIEAIHAAIGHVGDHGQRMPVGGDVRAEVERFQHAPKGQAGLHFEVAGDVKVIVIIDEIVTVPHHAAEQANGRQNQAGG